MRKTRKIDDIVIAEEDRINDLLSSYFVYGMIVGAVLGTILVRVVWP